jgi:transposase
MGSGQADLVPRVRACCPAGTTVYTDEWHPYAKLPALGLPHATVCHNNGIREVHCNTLEGLWTGLRNYLRPFRGVSKWYLDDYAAMFEWAYNLKAATDDFLRAMLRRPKANTRLGT